MEPFQYDDNSKMTAWLCIYETAGSSIHDLENSVRQSIESVLGSYPNSIKKSVLKNVNKNFSELEQNEKQPILKKYADRSIGFVRYVASSPHDAELISDAEKE